MSILRSLALVASIAAFAACSDDVASGGEDVEPGVSCTDSAACGALECLCVRGDGDIPGVCSTTCETDADCAQYGEAYSCSLDFCTGVNLCLDLVE
jgi:hypothetical protein